MPTYLGIDFSGDAAKWSAGCRRSNVWIAALESGSALSLTGLQRVQELPPPGAPFERLLRLLQTASFAAAGIDAPFSVPAGFLPSSSHAALLELVRGLPAARRPFPRGGVFARALRGLPGASAVPKPLRAAEQFWARQGVNVRSTLWNGARGGAPMTAACLALLARSGLPVWPWAAAGGRLLVEAFPAAQLRAWGLPHQRYNDPAAGAAQTRAAILNGIRLRAGLALPECFAAAALACADALDAILCAFAAKAVVERALHGEPGPAPDAEGWIAVHR